MDVDLLAYWRVGADQFLMFGRQRAASTVSP
jgi:hypothetical protein